MSGSKHACLIKLQQIAWQTQEIGDQDGHASLSSTPRITVRRMGWPCRCC